MRRRIKPNLSRTQIERLLLDAMNADTRIDKKWGYTIRHQPQEDYRQSYLMAHRVDGTAVMITAEEVLDPRGTRWQSAGREVGR